MIHDTDTDTDMYMPLVLILVTQVIGKKEVTSSFKRHLGSSSKNKTVTFRTSTEAEMNEALSIIKNCINTNGGMLNEDSPKVGTYF